MRNILILLFLMVPLLIGAQNQMVPVDHVLTDAELINVLNTDFSIELERVQVKYKEGKIDEALKLLAGYFKERFSERYLFDWKNFDKRFAEYNTVYEGRKQVHEIEANKHLSLYPASTNWKIPFTNLKGETVTSYPYRHLTRQQKSGDIALLYFYENDSKYLNYVSNQAISLNQAFDENQVETIEDGNGAYEAFRAGYRMFNWLFVHQCLLASEEYTWQQQIVMIKTFLHTGAQLYKNNTQFRFGNHQTRGMSALAMLSILFPEIQGTDKWHNRSLTLLEEHLEKEIYADGFQFERSVHYHISDIRNYFYPYQLAQINGVNLNPIWENRMKGLFDVLAKISFPDKNAPVLQDDTDSPWSEFNEIDEVMTLGAVLFEDAEFNYFASPKISSSNYWWFRQNQLEKLDFLAKKKPQIKSYIFPETGYYIMRKGWNVDDLYMITNAGLTPQKPDHQHGDMLGIGAYAHGNVILPNYQVRYYLEDLEEFKNSWLKNVVIVDSIPHGQKYKGNKGGSGFGKFGKLPVPKVIAWNSNSNSDFDFFSGTHNGYEEIGVEHYRSILFIKDGFWIVKDQLNSESGSHISQQIWQGHYDIEVDNKHVRSVFSNGAGLDIVQLNENVRKVSKASIRSKGRIVFENQFEGETNWTTLLFPFKDFEERLYKYNEKDFIVKGWRFLKENNPEGIKSDAKLIITKENKYFLSEVSNITINNKQFSVQNQKADMWISITKSDIKIINCGINTFEIQSDAQLVEINPGATETLKF